VHAGKLAQVTNFTIVVGTAKHCVDPYTVLFSLLFTRGRHCYAGRATCWAFLVNCYNYLEVVAAVLGPLYALVYYVPGPWCRRRRSSGVSRTMRRLRQHRRRSLVLTVLRAARLTASVVGIGHGKTAQLRNFRAIRVEIFCNLYSSLA